MLLVSRGSISTFRPGQQKKRTVRKKSPYTVKPKPSRPPISCPQRNVHTPQLSAEKTLVSGVIRAGLNLAGLAVMFLGPALLALTGQRSLHLRTAALPEGTTVTYGASERSSEEPTTQEGSLNFRMPDPLAEMEKASTQGYMVGAVDRRVIFQVAQAFAQPATQLNLMRALNLRPVQKADATISSTPATHYGHMVGAVDRRIIFSKFAEDLSKSKGSNLEKIQELLAPAGKSLETSTPQTYGHMVGAVDRRALLTSDMEKIFGKKIYGRMLTGRRKICFQEASSGSMSLPTAAEADDGSPVASFS